MLKLGRNCGPSHSLAAGYTFSFTGGVGDEQCGRVKMSRGIKILMIEAAVLVAVAVLLVDVIPPRSITELPMMGLKLRIMEYAIAHGELPSALAILPAREGHDNELHDA